jgi:hypothetical protein
MYKVAWTIIDVENLGPRIGAYVHWFEPKPEEGKANHETMMFEKVVRNMEFLDKEVKELIYRIKDTFQNAVINGEISIGGGSLHEEDQTENFAGIYDAELRHWDAVIKDGYEHMTTGPDPDPKDVVEILKAQLGPDV